MSKRENVAGFRSITKLETVIDGRVGGVFTGDQFLGDTLRSRGNLQGPKRKSKERGGETNMTQFSRECRALAHLHQFSPNGKLGRFFELRKDYRAPSMG